MANPGLVKSMVAEAAVLPYRVVKFGTADGQVIQAAAAADALVGVADNLGQSTAGHRVDESGKQGGCQQEDQVDFTHGLGRVLIQATAAKELAWVQGKAGGAPLGC